ncbi:MAG: Phosphoserine phosphatase RsbU [Chloroflexi bacterium ADurb.Bin360]|nr:MAG: Phosphoserine phosphatase RsbU [Chloroflexi bacterium ADurb.Bin360]
MEALWVALAKRFRPEIEKTADGVQRVAQISDVVSFLYGLPLAFAGLVWLILRTDLQLLLQIWPLLLILFGLLYLLRRLEFFLLTELNSRRLANASGTFESVITWSSALMFGPSVLWLGLVWDVIDLLTGRRRLQDIDSRWNRARNLVLRYAGYLLVSLAALELYGRWGGVTPLPGLSLEVLWPAIAATLFRQVFSMLCWAPYVLYYLTSKTLGFDSSARHAYMRFMLIALGWPVLMDPFALLAAGLWAQVGHVGYGLFLLSVLMVSYMAYRFSHTAIRNLWRSHEMANLERLARAILGGPPEELRLSEALDEHVPGMFPGCRIEIRIFPDATLLLYPLSARPLQESGWIWLRAVAESRCFKQGEALPWQDKPAETPYLLAPILDTESLLPIGGICLTFTGRVRHQEPLGNLLPAVQTLAAQIASALHAAKVHNQTLAYQRIEQELAVAGEIQAGFLLSQLSEVLNWQVSGWQIAVALESARETSGDFYDVIPLPNGQMALVIADVADKGLGSALYMAVSRTVIRTFAEQYTQDPAQVFSAANPRILKDTHADLFVTVFYGILDPENGTLTYCNAGHNPPFLFSAQNGRRMQALRRTGIPLGVREQETWTSHTICIAPGDLLILYTDGVTDAEDSHSDFFGEDRLLEALEIAAANTNGGGHTAQEVQDTIMKAVHDFVGQASQTDDITLMVLARDLDSEPYEQTILDSL